KSRGARRKSATPKKKFTWKKLIKYALIVFLIIGLGVTGLCGYYAATAPKLDLDKIDVPFASELLDEDDEVFASLYDENRKKIEYEDRPEVLDDAVTATEDARFFEHPGIDLRRIGGAVIANFKRGLGSV